MSVIDDRLQTRKADKAEALGEIAAVLAAIDQAGREPDGWERLSLLRAFSLVSAGWYERAAFDARDALRPVERRPIEPPDREAVLEADPTLALCDMTMLFEALKQAMADEARVYPHLGPVALG